MTANNSFKKHVRLRMKLTGESYTVARRKLYVPQSDNSIRPLVSLFEEEDLKNLNTALAWSKSRGLVVSSGPMYSGKTTTVNAMLNEVEKAYLMTVEDPIETKFMNSKDARLVRQMAVTDSLSAMDGIAYALRNRSTHLYLSEARSKEEMDALWQASTALRAFTTVHSDNSLATVAGRLRGDTPQETFDYNRLTAIIQHKMVKTGGGLFVLRAVIPNSAWVSRLLATEDDALIEIGLKALGIRTMKAKLEALTFE